MASSGSIRSASPKGLRQRDRDRSRRHLGGGTRRSCRRPPRPSIALWDAAGSRGWTCSSPTMETVVLNEVNTLPGMTSYSRYPRMMAAAGLPLCGCDRPDRVVGADGDATMNGRLRLRRRARARNTVGRQVRDLGQLHRQAGGRIPGQSDRRHDGVVRSPGTSARRGRLLGLRPASVGRLSPATGRRLLSALVAEQPEDGRTKLRHYPNIDRAEMFEKGTSPPSRATAGAAPST